MNIKIIVTAINFILSCILVASLHDLIENHFGEKVTNYIRFTVLAILIAILYIL